MDFYDVIKNRRSIRSYAAKTIPAEQLGRIIETVRLAPSACNRQPYRFELIKNPVIVAKIREACTQPWLQNADTFVAVIGDDSTAWRRANGDSVLEIDCAIAMEHLVLAAAAEGLGTCWICYYDQEKMDSALQVTKPWRTVAVTPLGYPAAGPRELVRKNTEEIFRVVE